ncbi:MAG: PPC domain-containing DNA-binding protein [Chloroflexota bacterium]
MRSKLIAEAGEKTYALIFDTGDEAASGLLDFAKEHGLAGSHFTAIGGFSRAILGYFDPNIKDYKKVPIDEQVEVLSLIGDVAVKDGEPIVHAHVVVGKSDGTAWGGHLIEGHVRPTLEVMLVETSAQLQREDDRETGLTMIRV